MALQTWLLYMLAATGLSVSPGPNSLLALSHGALYGRRMALFTLAGGALGFTVVIGLSMFGIGALLQAASSWLTALKWVGGAYLVWLGVQLWRAPPIQLLATPGCARAQPAGLARQGFLAAATNPKGILFFAAFLPHFMDPARGLWLQFAIMAGTFVLIEMAIEWLLASLAQRVAAWLARVGRGFNRSCAAVFVAMGVLLPTRG